MTENVERNGVAFRVNWEVKPAEVPHGMPSLERSGATAETVAYFNEALKQFPKEDQIHIEAAARFFSHLHAQNNQTRLVGKDEREAYANHVLRVASRIVNEFGIVDRDLMVAALGHDSAEDLKELLTGKSGATTDEALEVLKMYIGERSASIIHGVTNPDIPHKETMTQDEKNEIYAGHVIGSCEENPEIKPVKLSDFADNGLSVGGYLPIERQFHFAKKYLPLCVYFDDCLERGEIIADAEKREQLRARIHEVKQQYLNTIAEYTRYSHESV